MDWYKISLILIGYQKDCFSDDGILRSVIEETDRNNSMINNTLQLLQK